MNLMTSPTNFDAARALTMAQETLSIEAQAVTAMAQRLGDSFSRAVASVLACRGRVVVMGMGKSGHIGRKIAATLASTGTPAMFVHPAEASHGDMGMITPDDVIMALSWSGETAELKNLITYSRRFKIGLIAITSEAESTLGSAADICLTLPKAREACPHNLVVRWSKPGRQILNTYGNHANSWFHKCLSLIELVQVRTINVSGKP